MQDADAADLAQIVLGRLLIAAPEFRYDPSRGQFRAWLFTITRRELLKMGQRAARQAAASGGSEVRQILEQQPGSDAEQADWDLEYHWHLFEWAARKVHAEFRAATWQAFWSTAVENREAKQVAEELGMSVGAVYIARSRVLSRIRIEIEKVEGE